MRTRQWRTRKRVADYTRLEDSGRRSRAGQLMWRHRSDIHIDLLITGQGDDSAHAAEQLKRYFIGRYDPEWNRVGRAVNRRNG